VRLAFAGTDSRVHLPLMISVADNGQGIPEDLRAHLFDPFVSTKHNGKGLGLALVAKVVGDHGGVIEFTSEPRRTVFRVYLPIAPRDAKAEAEAE
jgi:two-component system nitrogen regulation sensor histidine kinase GlnL